ncbi:MAG: transcription-repair coupling factor [Chitinophagales bacterium]|nr:transcription-repair coupling factor [Chitinophagales bacterium]
MNFEELTQLFKNSKNTAQLLEQLSGSKQKIFLNGLHGSAMPFIAETVFRQSRNSHVFVLEDAISAAYFHNDLSSLITQKDIFFFPDSFKKSGQIHELNNSNVQLRTETINRITNPTTKAEIVITYPEALFEKVVKKQVLAKNMLNIKLQEKFDIDFAAEMLIEYGFERTDFVFEPGQFSVRGDIVDVFSFANEFPYRIELFDDEVESIRTFDPVSQLSQKKIERITIVPNVQTHFTKEEKTSFFEILTPRTCVWIKNMDYLIEVLDNNMNTALAVKEKFESNVELSENPFLKEDPREVFETPASILNAVQPFNIVEFGTKNYFKSHLTLAYKQQKQLIFNKNFDLLIQAFKQNEEKGIKNILFAENPKQIERFYHIFEDLQAEVTFYPINKAIHEGFTDEDLGVSIFTDHQIFNRYHKYKIRQGYSKDKALILKTLNELQPGDFVTHIDHGVGRYSGLEKVEVAGKMQEMVRIIYANNDLLYVGINSLHKIAKFSGKEGQQPKINKLGTDTWNKLKSKTKKQIKDIAEDLIKLYAKRKAQKGHAFPPDNYLQNELEASFIYEDTPDQEKATADIKEDMEKEMPMDRLICGDVGFGKTEVAMRAAFKAVCDSKQVAVLVPTTILAYQHYETFKERFADFPVTVDYINRFKSTAQKNDTLQKLKEGKIDILIGTHGIVGKKVKFKNLGLLIVDEEQKFGVAVKDKLKEFKANVDTLTLTATPIPRTMQFSLMGARDLSVIQTPPPNRQPVTTEVHAFSPDIIKEAIEFEVYRGGQVFFVHHKVKDLSDLKVMIHRMLPDVDVGIAHGQLEGHQLERAMKDFVEHKFDVLLSTNIIETGLDIPNANTIIINNAHMFGLSDLHQLRGRVGRSNKKAFCYLFAPPMSTLTRESRMRLKTIEEFAELGSGFNIAMRDLDIRGAGNLLGGEQSGFISEIGFETYHKILDEAITELKETEFKELYKEELKEKRDFVRDSQIDTDLEMLIPDNYINTVSERLAIYTDLNNCKNEEELKAFAQNLEDRFGDIPIQVQELFNAMRLKWLATGLGMERIIAKNGKMSCYFIQNQASAFYETEVFGKIIQFVQQFPTHAQLKQTDKYLILNFSDVASMQQAKERLEDIEGFVYQ